MRGGGRFGWAMASCLVVTLLPPPPVVAKGRKAPAAPPRGWVVDRVRVESLDPGGFVTAGGIGDFRGALDLVPARGGVAVLNEVALEDYVKGVSEVPSAWPLEAQRAQAIAARTFALHEMRRDMDTPARAVGADLCATQACQVYAGLAKERQEDGGRWVSAVESTRGQVLLYRGAPILAQYSSSNGGRSVAGGRPYLRSTADPDSARGPYNSWRVTLGYGQLAAVLGLPGPVTGLRRAGDAVVLDWAAPAGQSGQTHVPVPAFRDRLNEAVAPQGGLPRTVPSTQFSVVGDDATGTAVLEGRGNGHGIGMSQFGALGKASRGMRAADILASYYGGLRPTTLPPEQLPRTVRVALDVGLGSVTAGASGRFRVVDGAGSPVAVAASGAWRVLPAGRGKLRVVPPPDQEGAPALDSLAAGGPAPVLAAGEGTARFRVGSAALVRLRVEGPGLAVPLETSPVLVEPGEAALPMPPLPGPGRYVVTVLADAGAGRVSAASLPLRVRPGVPAGRGPLAAGLAPASAVDRPLALAWALLLLVLAALGRVLRHRVGRGERGGSPG